MCNLRCDNIFTKDEGWHAASKRYNEFLSRTENIPLLYLELGVGFNTAGIIKYPFWQRTFENKNAHFATINYGEIVTAEEIKDRSICIKSDIGAALKELL